jgi:hypothetical protein
MRSELEEQRHPFAAGTPLKIKHPAHGSRLKQRFIFAEEFIRERNESKVIPMTNDSPM